MTTGCKYKIYNMTTLSKNKIYNMKTGCKYKIYNWTWQKDDIRCILKWKLDHVLVIDTIINLNVMSSRDAYIATKCTRTYLMYAYGFG